MDLSKLLKQMREASEKATPGYWVVDRPYLSIGSLRVDGVMPEANFVETIHTHGTKSYAKHVAVPEHGHACDDHSQAARNMEHIAFACPANVTKLLDAIDTLSAALEYYEDKNGGPCAPGDWHTADGGKRAREALRSVFGKEGK